MGRQAVVEDGLVRPDEALAVLSDVEAQRTVLAGGLRHRLGGTELGRRGHGDIGTADCWGSQRRRYGEGGNRHARDQTGQSSSGTDEHGDLLRGLSRGYIACIFSVRLPGPLAGVALLFESPQATTLFRRLFLAPGPRVPDRPVPVLPVTEPDGRDRKVLQGRRRAGGRSYWQLVRGNGDAVVRTGVPISAARRRPSAGLSSLAS